MHLKKTKRNGRVYLSVVQNYREGDATKTRTVETIGYADAYEKEFADPIAHFEEYVADLNRQRRKAKHPIDFSFPRDCTIDADRTESARWGAALSLAYLDALDAKRALAPDRCEGAQRKADEQAESIAIAKRTFEVFAVERMLHASPKHETWERRESFPRACDFAIDEAYRALAVIAAADSRIARTMRASYERIRPKHAPLACAHVILGTFAFDDTDDVGSAKSSGGPSSGRVAVCLAMVLDEDGMPAGYRLIGADPDAKAVRNLAAEIKHDLGAERIVFVAGRLTHAISIMKTLAADGDGFIMHRPLETDREDLQHWVIDDRGYTTAQSGSYRIKSRVRAAIIDPLDADGPDKGRASNEGGNGSKAHGPQPLNADETADEAEEAIEKPDDVPKNASPVRACRPDERSSHGARLSHGDDRRAENAGARGEARPRANAPRSTPVRDIVFWGRDYAQRLKSRHKASGQENPLDGYACIVTSEIDLAAPEVFHLYRELWRLAEPFQVLESDFSPSPYPTPRDIHMRAHFIICYAAFFAMRLMRSDLKWKYNAAQVADALARMEGSYLAENWFLFGYRSAASDAIERAAGVDEARRLRTRQDIRRGIAQARRHIKRE